MEIKKNVNADLEKTKGTSLMLGFVIALAVMFVSLEWTQRDVRDDSDMYRVSDISFTEEMAPITLPEKKTVPPPPAAVRYLFYRHQLFLVDINTVTVVEPEPEIEDDTEFLVVEDQPEFPGGTAALLEYLRKNIRYPSICRENNIQGRVIVTFVVNKDGNIVNPEVAKGVNPSLDKEALRVISQMPSWKPGKQRGKPVKVRYSVPVNFRLN